MILITFVCGVCGQTKSKSPDKKDIVSFGEEAFVLQASGLLPDGWRFEDSKLICPRCLLFKKNLVDEIRCSICKKVSICVTEDFLQEGISGLERLSRLYSFKKVGDDFVCIECSKRNEKEKKEQKEK